MSEKIKPRKPFFGPFISTAKKYLTANLINIILAFLGTWYAIASYKLTKNDKSQETQINQLGQITRSEYAQIDTLSKILSSQNSQISKLNELIASQHSQVDTLVKIAKSIDSQNLLTINQNGLIQNQIALANKQNLVISQQNKSILGISNKISSQLKLSEKIEAKKQYDSAISHKVDLIEFINEAEVLYDSLSNFADFEVKEKWLDSSKLNLLQLGNRMNEIISNLYILIKQIYKNPISLGTKENTEIWNNMFEKIHNLNRDYLLDTNKLTSYSEYRTHLNKIIDLKKYFEEVLIAITIE